MPHSTDIWEDSLTLAFEGRRFTCSVPDHERALAFELRRSIEVVVKNIMAMLQARGAPVALSYLDLARRATADVEHVLVLLRARGLLPGETKVVEYLRRVEARLHAIDALTSRAAS
jgi:hypothetical protein